MSTLNFPSSPSTGDLYAFNEYTYRYDGEKWTTISPGSVATLRADLASGNGYTLVGFSALQDFADDSAAALGGVPLWGLYRTGSVVKVRAS